jgi:hypothetical protein
MPSCSNCGAPVEADDRSRPRTCRNCGADFTADAPQSTVAQDAGHAVRTQSEARGDALAAARAWLAAVRARALAIVRHPRREWPVIAAEDTAPAALYAHYIAPLAAIGPLAKFIASMATGTRVPGLGTLSEGAGAGLQAMFGTYAIALASVFLMALIANALAPAFDARRSLPDALKLVAYASTPVWLAGVFAIVPVLGILVLPAGLYAFHLVRLGLPVMMKCPPAKALSYAALWALLSIVAAFVVSLAGHAFMPRPGP